MYWSINASLRWSDELSMNYYSDEWQAYLGGKGGGLNDFLQPTVSLSIFRRERTANLFSEARRVRYLNRT